MQAGSEKIHVVFPDKSRYNRLCKLEVVKRMEQEKNSTAEQKYIQEHSPAHGEGHSHAHESGHGHTHEPGHGHTHGEGHVHPNAKAVSNRLAKAIGHLESVKRMVDRGEDCSDILIQLAAVRSAINNAGKVLLMDHLNHCIVDAVEDGNMASIEEFGEAIQKFVK